jgi:hypothetical protein
MMLTSKQLFLVMNPGTLLHLMYFPAAGKGSHNSDQAVHASAGGSTAAAYREDEPRAMVPRNKSIPPVKSVTINVEAFCSPAGLGQIAAVHASSAGVALAPSAGGANIMREDTLITPLMI